MENIALITKEKEKKLIYWFAKQNQEIKKKVFEEKKSHFFKLKNNSLEKNEILDYISFILSINEIYEKLQYSKKKNKSNSLNEIQNISELELKSMRKDLRKEKYDAVVDRITIIEKLRSLDYSWRKISSILKTKYRQDISHTYIIKVFKGLKNGY